MVTDTGRELAVQRKPNVLSRPIVATMLAIQKVACRLHGFPTPINFPLTTPGDLCCKVECLNMGTLKALKLNQEMGREERRKREKGAFRH